MVVGVVVVVRGDCSPLFVITSWPSPSWLGSSLPSPCWWRQPRLQVRGEVGCDVRLNQTIEIVADTTTFTICEGLESVLASGSSADDEHGIFFHCVWIWRGGRRESICSSFVVVGSSVLHGSNVWDAHSLVTKKFTFDETFFWRIGLTWNGKCNTRHIQSNLLVLQYIRMTCNTIRSTRKIVLRMDTRIVLQIYTPQPMRIVLQNHTWRVMRIVLQTYTSHL